MRLRREVLLLLAIGPLLAVAGCTNSDPTTTGNSPITISIEAVESGTRFDFLSSLQITQLTVRPNDPMADQALGESAVGLFSAAEDVLTLDLNEPGEVVPTTITLSSGSWRLSDLRMKDVLMLATDRTTPWVECDEGPVFITPPGPGFPIDSVALGGDTNFTVSAAGEAQLIIRIRIPELVEAFTNSFDCIGDPPFAITFLEEDFVALAPTYIELVSVTP